jgi:DinB superfamily
MAHRATPRHPAPAAADPITRVLMNSECNRNAEQLASTIDGPAWYGDSVREILADVTADRARARPIANGHSIWEIVAHLDAWIGFFSRAIDGAPIPPWPTMPNELDWPPVTDSDERAWEVRLGSFFENHRSFVEKIRTFGDERLEATVPGRTYNFRRMFQSASLHAAYHAGQIALLKKAV